MLRFQRNVSGVVIFIIQFWDNGFCSFLFFMKVKGLTVTAFLRSVSVQCLSMRQE